MSKLFNLIQNTVEQKVRLLDIGFLKRKNIYNRKTECGLTQVIHFWGYDRYGEHRLQMLYGVRVAEIINESFEILDDKSGVFFDAISIGGECKSLHEKYQAYYQVTERSCAEIVDDICIVIEKQVLPMFDALETRNKIIHNIQKYQIDRFSQQLRNLFFIYGAKGDRETAKKLIDEYFTEVVDRFDKGDIYIKNGIPRLFEVVRKNSIEIDPKIIEKYNLLIVKFLEERGLKTQKMLDEMLLK